MGNEKEDTREKKPKKSIRGVQAALRILQHAALVVMAVSIFVVVFGASVRIFGFRTSFTSYRLYTDERNTQYEDSGIFNNMLGYAVADVIRFGVVRSQLETDGAFDGSKVIDVTAYNYRDTGLPETYVTADYKLEDLLKWSNYGFEYNGTEMTESQARRFLADATRVTMVDSDSKYYNTSDAGYLKSNIESYTFVSDVSANQILVATSGADPSAYDGFVEGYQGTSGAEVEHQASEPEGSESETNVYDILVNRYKTVENKNIEEYVSDWELYWNLCSNVQNAANSLAYNYAEYQEFGEYYGGENSNLRYLISKTVGDNTQYYSNLPEKEEENIIEAMQSDDPDVGLLYSGRYIYYSPSQMQYATNTAITEDMMREVLGKYDYAYPETIKIWFSVDTAYPVDDAFAQGATSYQRYVPYYWQWIMAAVLAGLMYLVILCYLTVTTGKDVDEEGNAYIRLTSFDKVPTEAALLVAAGAAILMIFVLILVTELLNLDMTSYSDWFEFYNQTAYISWEKVLLMVIIFVFDAIFLFFFYSLVRRIKARELWKNSFLRRLAYKTKDFLWKVYDNGDTVLRTWVPYGVFLLFNLLLCIWGVRDGYPFLLAGVIDIGVGVLLYRDTRERQNIVEGIETIAGGSLEHQVNTEQLHGDNLTLAQSVNSIGNGIKEAVEISMKDERMKADLITNVSHDIKTPLTSIINYVDLIKREDVENEKVRNYIRVLDEKSQRLKQLTDDLVEASKISSGNINLQFERINLTELMNQALGEFSEKFEEKDLTTVMSIHAQNVVIEADSRRIWRVMENLFNNIFKYAMPGTRVYVSIDSMEQDKERIEISIKNISASPLNCNPEELTERFIRGDESRTTEGSGLGLSIAKNLTQAQNGTFEIVLDGDLFKVYMTFPLAKDKGAEE